MYKLKYLRESELLTQKQIAKKIGCGHRAYADSCGGSGFVLLLNGRDDWEGSVMNKNKKMLSKHTMESQKKHIIHTVEWLYSAYLTENKSLGEFISKILVTEATSEIRWRF